MRHDDKKITLSLDNELRSSTYRAFFVIEEFDYSEVEPLTPDWIDQLVAETANSLKEVQ